MKKIKGHDREKPGHDLIFRRKTQDRVPGVFGLACSLYILSLLIVLPFMSWRDTAYAIAIALIGYGLGKWKGKVYETHILPLVIAYLAAKPFLHYGPNPTSWSWQRYTILVETAVLGGILLATEWRSTDPVEKKKASPIRLFPAAIVFAFGGLIVTCAVPCIFGRVPVAELMPQILAVFCFAVIYPTFIRYLKKRADGTRNSYERRR